MPRVLLDKNSSANKYRKLAVLLNGAAALDSKSPELIGKVIGMSRNTAHKYLESPEKLPLDKLLRLGKNLNIPIEDLRECMRY